MIYAQRVRTRTAGALLLLMASTLWCGCGETHRPAGQAAQEGKRAPAPTVPGPAGAKAAAAKPSAAPAAKVAPAEAIPAPMQPLTREHAIAVLEKVGVKFYYDESKPGKPLDRIRLQDPRIRDDALPYLKAFPEVPNIDIVYFNYVTDAGMVHLAAFPDLKRLELEGTHITDAGLEHIKGMTKLQYLNLIDTDITGKGLIHLKGLAKLGRLRLGFTNVDDDGLEHLTGLGALKVLELDDTAVTQAAVERLRKALPQCDVQWHADGVAAKVHEPLPPGPSAPQAGGPQQSAAAGEWPQWRGPNRDGVSLDTGLLETWPDDGPPLKWEVRGVGWGCSTVVIQNGKLFTTGRVDETSFLFALNSGDGAQLWKTPLAPGNDDPFATPTADGELIYALSREGELVCAESATGKEVWRRNFAKEFGGRYMSYQMGGGYSESVLVDGDLLIGTPGGKDAFVVAFNKKTGEVVWKVPLPANFGPQGVDAAGFSSPVASTACGIRQYVQMTGRGLISISVDGKVLWTHNSIANTYNNVATPIIAGDYVFASTSHAGDIEAGTALLKLVPEAGGIKVEEVYRLPERVVANHHGGMIRVGDYVYMGHGYNRGFPLCLELATGKVMWKPGRGPGAGSASIAYADGHLYFHYENGVVALIEAKPDAYKLKSTFKLPFTDRWEWAHPVVVGGCLYLRGENWLRCYDVKQPGSAATVGANTSAPAGSQQSNIYLPFKEPLTPEQAVSELKKVRGQVILDEKNPDKPVVGVWLQNPGINDANLAAVKWLPALSRINLVAVNGVTDAGLSQFKGLTNLKQLNLEGTRIGDSGLEHLKGLVNLELLNLIDTNVTSAGLVHLEQMKNLKRLKLSFTDVDDAGIEHLSKLTGLDELALDDAKVTETGANKLRQALPKCKVLTSTNRDAVVDAIDLPAETVTTPAVAAASIPAEPPANGDWPQWRGSNRDGLSHETGLLQEWPESGPPLKWEAPGIGWGFSTVVVRNGTVFTTGYLQKKAMAAALDAATGKQLWQADFAADGERRMLSTPTIDREFLFALAREGELACLKVDGGAIVWRRNLAAEFGGKYQSAGIGGGFSESVLIDANLLVCTPGGPEAMMAGLNKLTGTTLWQAKYPAESASHGIDAAGFSSPVVSDACGIRQYVQHTGRGLMSVNAEGKVLWTYNRIANKFGNIPTPIIQGDYVFASTAHANDGMSGTALLKVVPDNGGVKVEEVYRAPERAVANHHGGMVLVGDCIYMGHGYNRGFPLCLEMKTGKVMWRPGRGPGSGSASVVYADGHLYFRYEDGTVVLVQATPEAYVLKSKFRTPPDQDTEWAHPVVNGGCLYLRGQNRLLCYDVTKH